MVTHGPVPAREMEEMSPASYIFTQQTPTAPGPGLSAGVTEVNKRPVSGSSRTKNPWLQWHKISALGVDKHGGGVSEGGA